MKMLFGEKVKTMKGNEESVVEFLKENPKRNIPLKRAKRLDEDLKKEYLFYRNVGLTDRYVVALGPNSSPSGIYTSIKYSDILWIYIGDDGSRSFYDALSVEKSISKRSEERLEANYLTGKAVDLATGLIDLALIGMPVHGQHTSAIIFSKSRNAIIVTDDESRQFLPAISPFSNSVNGSKEFKKFLGTLVQRCESNVLIGEDLKEEYLSTISKIKVKKQA